MVRTVMLSTSYFPWHPYKLFSSPIPLPTTTITTLSPMATTTSLSSLFSLFPTKLPKPRPRRQSLIPVAKSQPSNFRKEDIVVVGAGIAGLATALSLHKLGVPSLVLEQGESLRAGGTSLTLFKNGWRVLDAVGVGDELRSKFLEIQGLVMRSEDGRELRSFSFQEEAPGQEVRAVERRALLETLASRLPSDSISYLSKVKGIEMQGDGGTVLELEDGSKILAKIVIGCDGIRSPVAKWMGFSEPKYVGHCAFRGLGFYPDGQPFKPKVNYFYGKGLRAGLVPVSPTKVYWFICFNSPSPGPKLTNPSILKKQALDLVRGWPSELLDTMQKTPDNVIIKSLLVDRWLWPGFSPPASNGNVVVVGDSWHPMTPNLGQGACCALEDSVVLAAKLARALSGGPEVVDRALRDFSNERWARIFQLTVRANLVGSLLQWDNPVVCGIRNSFVIPKLVRLGPFLEHTNFECELMEPVASM